MLWTILVVLIVLWALGLLASVGGAAIHLLLVLALVGSSRNSCRGAAAPTDGLGPSRAHPEPEAAPLPAASSLSAVAMAGRPRHVRPDHAEGGVPPAAHVASDRAHASAAPGDASPPTAAHDPPRDLRGRSCAPTHRGRARGGLVSTSPGGPPRRSAASVCTGWTSNVVPPQTIRVLRTTGPAAGSVQTVPFRQYVTRS